MLRIFIFTSVVIPPAFVAPPVQAQANANAVAGANDAFGFRNGDEAVGIYDETSVRGFSLEAAGNYRVNGSYFVKNSGVSAFFLDSTTVRIGYNTLSSILPGPSGVVDYRLRDPVRGEPSAVTIGLEAYMQPYAEIHLKHRASDNQFSYSVGASRVFEIRDGQGGRGGEALLIAGATRLGAGGTTANIFLGEYQYRRPGVFRVAPTGEALPSMVERGRFLGQRWAMEEGQRRIGGALVDASIAENVGIGGTLVFSQEDPTRGFAQLFRNFAPDGTAQSVIIALPQQRSTAWSGELRARLAEAVGALQHRVDLTIRGRRQRALFGGSQVVDLGRSVFGERATSVAAPDMGRASAGLRDAVDQWGVGIAYRGAIREVVRFNTGLLRTHYRKRFRSAEGRLVGSRASPWLYNVGVALRAHKGLEFYGSYSRGLEEAGVAPAVATNRNEILSAIQVTQRELGVRVFPRDALSLVVAAFDTRKPYAGIDAAGAYRFLGQVRHRGVETSFSGKPVTGLTVVIGGVAIDSSLAGEEVSAGRLGGNPVGVPKLRAIANFDYALPFLDGMNVDAGLTYVGSRAARSRAPSPGGEQLRVPSFATASLGLRYKFRLGKLDLVARGQVLNLLDQASWDVNGSETLAYTAPRRIRLVLTTLF